MNGVSKWKEEDVANVIRKLGKSAIWGKYAQIFLDNNIDGSALSIISLDELKAFGINALHARRIILELQKQESETTWEEPPPRYGDEDVCSMFSPLPMVDSSPATSNMMCSKHPMNPLSFICTEDKALICTDCLMFDHNGHKCQFIDAAYRDEQGDIKNLISAAESATLSLKKAVSEALEVRRVIRAKESNAKKEIESHFVKVRLKLVQRERYLFDKVEAFTYQKTQDLSNHLIELNAASTNVRETLTDLKMAAEAENKGYILMKKRELNKRISESLRAMQPLSKGDILFNPPELDVDYWGYVSQSSGPLNYSLTAFPVSANPKGRDDDHLKKMETMCISTARDHTMDHRMEKETIDHRPNMHHNAHNNKHTAIWIYGIPSGNSSTRMGLYKQQEILNDGRAVYKNTKGFSSLWYDKSKNQWIVGSAGNVGTTTASIFAYAGTTEHAWQATDWHRYNNKKWEKISLLRIVRVVSMELTNSIFIDALKAKLGVYHPIRIIDGRPVYKQPHGSYYLWYTSKKIQWVIGEKYGTTAGSIYVSAGNSMLPVEVAPGKWNWYDSASTQWRAGPNIQCNPLV